MKRKFVPLMLLPLLALTSCGEVTAKPTNYEDPLVVLLKEDGSKGAGLDVYNNLNKIIYDAKLDGGVVAKEVLNDVLLTLAETVFGTYEELEAVTKADAKAEDVKAFINAHKVYHYLDKEGNRSDANYAKEVTKVKMQKERIIDRIAEKFFEAIKSSFTRDGYFYEEDYLMSLVSSLKNVKTPTSLDLNSGILIPPEFDGKDVFTKELTTRGGQKSTLLHLENYKDAEGKFDYYRKDIANEIYRELLVEQYLFESNYSAISRAYAREVEIVTISNRDDAPLAANNLMNAYVDNFVNVAPVATTAETEEAQRSTGLDLISEVWRGDNLKGLAAEDPAKILADEAFGAPVTYEGEITVSGADEYYVGTSFGSLCNKLTKLSKDAKKTDTTIESEFTNNGEHTIAEGFEDKLITVKQENYITDGWHLRNGGLSSLSEKMRTRLFNIGVANALDNNEYPDRFNAGTYNNHPEHENSYVAKINGRYFLKPSTTEKPSTSDKKMRDMIWYDESAKSFTIIEIKNATSSAKLARNNEDNYENREGGSFENMERIAHNVAYELAKGDSYRSLSTKHWLEAASLAYNDDDIKGYFEENYPDLFKD